jgi:hypothetical protein
MKDYNLTLRKPKTKYLWGCRCYERLQPNTKEFTRLVYTWDFVVYYESIHLLFAHTVCKKKKKMK